MQFGLSPVNLTHPLLPIERVLTKHLSNGNPTNICENFVAAAAAICNESSSSQKTLIQSGFHYCGFNCQQAQWPQFVYILHTVDH